ncbi:hypothetical protein ACLOJK_027882 [Asimina triloba]
MWASTEDKQIQAANPATTNNVWRRNQNPTRRLPADDLLSSLLQAAEPNGPKGQQATPTVRLAPQASDRSEAMAGNRFRRAAIMALPNPTGLHQQNNSRGRSHPSNDCLITKTSSPPPRLQRCPTPMLHHASNQWPRSNNP